MKIKSLQLKNFKRFTDLTLQDIPENAKLVLLIGSNGSGKSSVFDAFESLSTKLIKGTSKDRTVYDLYNEQNSNYYFKNSQPSKLLVRFNNNEQFECIYDKDQGITIYGNVKRSNIFYGRSAIRYLPKITKTSIGQTVEVQKDEDRPSTYIEVDKRFENDIDLMIKDVVENVFKGINTDSTKQLDEIKSFLERINKSFQNIFGARNGTNLIFKSFIPPANGKPSQLIFQKGTSEINYNLLSAGEKEIVNLLFNLFVRSKYYNDTIYFMDEVDSHLNTKLQHNVIKEIVENWIPDNCQFWTASHSLGFIDYANEYENGCIIDFDDLDFDEPQVLSPKPKNDFEIFELAVSKAFIDKVVQGRKIIFSENTDTPFYNDLNIPNTFFFVSLDKNDVFHKAKNHKQHGLMDRDFLADEELQAVKAEYPFLYILPYYSIENLFYHPDNLEEYFTVKQLPYDKENYKHQLTVIKNRERDYLSAGIVQARSGYPFYKENENSKKLKEFRDKYRLIIDLLRSDDFETFYRVFPAKDYGEELNVRKNLLKIELAKTAWFKNQIEALINRD